MTVWIINGPNINLLGVREPQIYGTESYDELCARARAHAEAIGLSVRIMQTNHEGELIDFLQQARAEADGIILNAAGYTHTSVAIRDAVCAIAVPTVEVHLSDPDRREPFRKINFLRDVCFARIVGRGIGGYLDALDLLKESIENGKTGT